MSRLNDVISRVVELETNPSGNLDLHRAVTAARPLLDDEDVDVLVREALTKRIKDAATRGFRAAANEGGNQSELFPHLRRAHAIDTEGRMVVNTDDMTELQFRRVIEIRRKQIRDDRAYLDELEQAFREVEPIWHLHPDFTFGQACRVLVRWRVA